MIGPGSLFTSLLASLLFGGIAEACARAAAWSSYVCNTTTQPGQTDGYTALDHVGADRRSARPRRARRRADQPQPARRGGMAHYAADGVYLLQPDDAEIAAIRALGVEPIVHDFGEPANARRALWNKQDTVRHDSATLGDTLRELLKR